MASRRKIQARDPQVIGLGRAVLSALQQVGGPGLPAGFEVTGEGLTFSLLRQESARGKPLLLQARHLWTEHELGVLAERLGAAPTEGGEPGWVIHVRIALETEAAAAAEKLAGGLESLWSAVEGPLRAVEGAARVTGQEKAPDQLLSRLPSQLFYEKMKTQLEPYEGGARSFLRKALPAKLDALREAGLLPAAVAGVDTKGARPVLDLRRRFEPLFQGAPLPIEVRTTAPLPDELIDRLAWAGEGEELSGALADALAAEDRHLERELARALRYAAVILDEEGGHGLVEREVIASTIAQALARGGEIETQLRAAIARVAEQARNEKFQADLTELERHRGHYADVGGYYPVARSMQRTIELFIGPTNSGKTYRALNALTECETGVYLAPLRLLALEGQFEIEGRGKPCSYVTGEEREIRPGAPFTSSTIEMMDYRTPVDAVLIDEIQLLSDRSRGWAWTAALVGAPARKVILTGAPTCRAAVEQIAGLLGEKLTVTETHRLAPLEVEKRPISLSRLTRGTAVIAFSRRDVLDLKSTIEQVTGLKCAVIYGNLSPRVRREEARRFREGEADILVSTDAIAMGLNLPIERIVFFTTVKFDGQKERRLDDQEFLQIGGRAGRYGKAARGLVTTLSREGLADVHAAFNRPPTEIGPPFLVMPDDRHVSLFSEVLETQSLERILVFFARAVTFDDEVFAPADLTDLCALAAIVDRKLPDADARIKLIFASAPVEVDNEKLRRCWERMMTAYLSGEEKLLDDIFDVEACRRRGQTTDPMQLLDAENQLKVLTIYSWLSYRFPRIFQRIEECDAAKDVLAAFIESSLRGRTVRRCSTCGVQLPLGFRFPQCNNCHFNRKGNNDVIVVDQQPEFAAQSYGGGAGGRRPYGGPGGAGGRNKLRRR
jgi:ATP-dependent RNA helicase SUPV3L1/SUV3